MPSNKAIAVVSLLPCEGEYDAMYKSIGNYAQKSNYHVQYENISNKNLDGEITVHRSNFQAVILIHSVKDGRLSITDVEDAKYDTLLPALRKEFGLNNVAVIVFSVQGRNVNTKLMLDAFEVEQPSAILCSCHVVLSDSTDISTEEWESISTSFNKGFSTRQRQYDFLIIGIKPHTPLLIMEEFENQFESYDAGLTFKTLAACEKISVGSFSGAFLVCRSQLDLRFFRAAIRHAKTNKKYVEAMYAAKKLKAVFLPQNSSADFAEECRGIFQDQPPEKSDECKILKYNFDRNGENKSVSFTNGTPIEIEKTLKETIHREEVSSDGDEQEEGPEGQEKSASFQEERKESKTNNGMSRDGQDDTGSCFSNCCASPPNNGGRSTDDTGSCFSNCCASPPNNGGRSTGSDEYIDSRGQTIEEPSHISRQ